MASDSHAISDQKLSRMAKALEAWFSRAQRDLSWRKTRDPYAIWVSEIMLQQTRVETVENYYGEFLQRFPSVGELAAADEDDVLSQWSGLGYYRRARLLHKGARYVADDCQGELPRTREGLLAIPGVGPYTAGAIGSIAFNKPIPLVDGNVARVLSRWLAIEAPAQQDAKHSAHWEIVERALRQGTPRVLAQALMELGATVCTPRNPQCSECPIKRSCAAKKKGLVDTIPVPKKKKASPTIEFWAGVIRWKGRRLFVRLPEGGLLSDMWCLPLELKRVSDGHAENILSPALRDKLEAAFSVASGVPVELHPDVKPMVKHIFTHRVWKVWVCEGEALERPSASVMPKEVRAEWVFNKKRPRGGVPTLTEKLLAAVDE